MNDRYVIRVYKNIPIDFAYGRMYLSPKSWVQCGVLKLTDGTGARGNVFHLTIF